MSGPRRHLVSLAMYAVPAPALAAISQALLSRMAAAGFEARFVEPDDLAAHWTDPDLLLAQTCGYPLLHALKGRVRLVATPCYAAPGCAGPLYGSALVVRAEDPAEGPADLRGRVAAYNARDSQSGYNTLRAAVAPLAREGRFFGRVLETGSHLASLRAVEEGRADLAAIDAVTLALDGDRHPDRPLRILGFTDMVPALPFVTAGDADDAEVDALRRILDAVAADPALAPARGLMRLKGFDVLPEDAYAPIVEQERRAAALGYPRLA